MKIQNVSLLCLIFTMALVEMLFAQTSKSTDPVVPIQCNRSPVFGNDLFINDQPSQNQRPVAICSAFNGWLYAAYIYDGTLADDNAVLNPIIKIAVLQSKDNGNTWTFLFDDWWPIGEVPQFSTIDIVTTGNSISNLKIILSYVIIYHSNLMGDGYVMRLNGMTGAFESTLLTVGACYDIALASDLLFPPSGSSPNNLGILYTKNWGSPYSDSLHFKFSNDGGMTVSDRTTLAFTNNRFHNVSLSYGRSQTWNSGLYFAAWEEQDQYGLVPGRIFTSHNISGVASQFTTPINIDGIDPLNANLCRNPTIACQSSNYDNDSSNITEILLFERWNQTTFKNDIIGYYNLQAANNNRFLPLNFTDSQHNNCQPDILFNPYDSVFMVTYFDSTVQKLPYLSNRFNLSNPNQWNILSLGYNDNGNITKPLPRIVLNQDLHSGATAWIADRNDGNGIAMYDAVPHFWVGLPETHDTNNPNVIRAFPNPCTNIVFFDIRNCHSARATIDLMDLLGNVLKSFNYQISEDPHKTIEVDVTNFKSGTYVYHYKCDNDNFTGLFSVVK